MRRTECPLFTKFGTALWFLLVSAAIVLANTMLFGPKFGYTVCAWGGIAVIVLETIAVFSLLGIEPVLRLLRRTLLAQQRRDSA